MCDPGQLKAKGGWESNLGKSRSVLALLLSAAGWTGC